MNNKKYADGGPLPNENHGGGSGAPGGGGGGGKAPETGRVKVEIATVTIFQPGTIPAIYNTTDGKIENIEAGITNGQPRVTVTKKDGTKIMSVGLPFIVFTDPPKNV